MTEQATGLARALLASDDLARGWAAGGLNPRLRAALQAGLHFPVRATAPAVQDTPARLPGNALSLPPRPADRQQAGGRA